MNMEYNGFIFAHAKPWPKKKKDDQITVLCNMAM